MGQVISISSETSVLEAAQKLLQYKASELPVTDSTGNLVGVVTKANILHRVKTVTEWTSLRWLRFAFGREKLAKDYIHLHGLKVREVMSKKFFSTPDDASLTDIVRFMERHRIKWLPVVRDRKLIGIIRQDGLDAAKLLLCRMAALHLDEKAVAKSKPIIMRELQQLCTTCASQKRCKRDLANSPENPVWQQYCPNAGALVALQGQPAATILDALTKALDAAELQFIRENGDGVRLIKAPRKKKRQDASGHRKGPPRVPQNA